MVAKVRWKGKAERGQGKGKRRKVKSILKSKRFTNVKRTSYLLKNKKAPGVRGFENYLLC
jgi:hypothetical protein